SKIAAKVYGNPADWKYVWRQNSEISNPDKLEVGQIVYYLSSGALGAALKSAKDITVAKLIEKNVTKKVKTVEAKHTKAQPSNANSDNQEVNGFELAKNMFNVFVTDLATAG